MSLVEQDFWCDFSIVHVLVDDTCATAEGCWLAEVALSLAPLTSRANDSRRPDIACRSSECLTAG